MSDYADLLARLDGPSCVRLSDDLEHYEADPDHIAKERAECAAAIRTLIAEQEQCISANHAWASKCAAMFAAKESAAAAEREACAKICDSLASSIAAKLARPPARMESHKWFETMESAQEEAEECAAQIRARGNSDG